jgi:pSer/pThr/pTyr-binding forkhead associated (FHA) protein
MDENHKPEDKAVLPLQGPHWERASGAGFLPLRMVLLPSGLSVDLVRPEILVGRHSSADVRLPLPDVSRRHCRFVFSNGGWQIFDLDSLNGIFVNGTKVARADLHDGDSLSIGSFRFVLEIKSRKQTPAEKPEDMIQSIAEVFVPAIFDFGQPQRKAS